MTRVAAGAIPDFRAARRASVPLSRIFFRFFIPPQAGILAELEIKGYLQIDAAIGRRRRVRSAGKPVGLAEERRTQVADGRGEIDVIKTFRALTLNVKL